MERVDGHKVTEPGAHGPADRRRLAELIVEALIAGPIWSPAPQATFHADPHAGNLFVTPDRRLAILDWSLTGSLGEDERVAMTQLVLGGLSLTRNKSAPALLRCFEQRVDETDLERSSPPGSGGSAGQFPGLLLADGHARRRRAPRSPAGRRRI